MSKNTQNNIVTLYHISSIQSPPTAVATIYSWDIN